MQNKSRMFDANEIFYNDKPWYGIRLFLAHVGGDHYTVYRTEGEKYFSGDLMFYIMVYGHYRNYIGTYYGKVCLKTKQVVFNMQRYEFDVFLNRNLAKYNLE